MSKRKPNPTKPHKREPRKPFENGYLGYVSPAAKEFALWFMSVVGGTKPINGGKV